jgi:ribosomal-protein-alanine N-acetyltransferase
MSEVRIRPMALADIDIVIALAASLDSAPHWPRSAYESALDAMATPRRIALLAEISGAVIGFAIASLVPPQAELETIAVSLPFQRCKAGSALMTALIHALESSRVAEITLEVRASNQAAQAFYRSHCFENHGQRNGYYPDTGEHAVIMRAVLSLTRK